MVLTEKQINIIAENAANLMTPQGDDDCPEWLRAYHHAVTKLKLLNGKNTFRPDSIEQLINARLSDRAKKQLKSWIKG